MDKQIRVFVDGIGEVYVEEGSTLEEISKQVYENNYKNYLGARVNNQIYHLRKEAKENMYIKFLDISTQDGYRIYTRTISAVFMMACREVFPQCTAKIEHFLGEGLYAELEEGHSISFGEIEKLKKKWKKLLKMIYQL